MKRPRPTYPDTMLEVKQFSDVEELMSWANGEFGTDYIISISQTLDGVWLLFYIKEIYFHPFDLYMKKSYICFD